MENPQGSPRSCYTGSMIARISGKVVETLDKGVILETAGVGYAIYTPALLSLGATVTLYTHLVIRDDAHELYGFETSEEKSLFATLINVSGVGPKTALQMLTLYPLPDLVRAIRMGDAKSIALVPGIGKKTAEKVVIDLKDKLAGYALSDEARVSSDLVEALLSLGFKEVDVRLALPTVDAELPLERQITIALQLLKK